MRRIKGKHKKSTRKKFIIGVVFFFCNFNLDIELKKVKFMYVVVLLYLSNECKDEKNKI